MLDVRYVAASTMLLWVCACVGGRSVAGDAGSMPGSASASVPITTTPASDAGATPLQRLTQSEYMNSVVDILHLPATPNVTLPADELTQTFFANTGAPIDDLSLQQYLNAASSISLNAPLVTLMACGPSEPNDACAARYVPSLGMSLYRRPLSSTETATYLAILKQYGSNPNDWLGGVREVLQTMLISPNFLFKVEAATEGQVTPASAYELATRLSYFLWSSAPDAQLLAAANSNALLDPNVLQEQAVRMIADPRFVNGLRSFTTQWLALTQLPQMSKDANDFPGYSSALASAMQDEATNFSDWVIRKKDSNLQDLMTSPTSVLTDPLFVLYGVTKPENYVSGTAVPLDPNQRAGLLTLSAFLTAQAHADQSAPVLRGKIVLTNIMCRSVPPPPANVSTALPPVNAGTTTRERLDTHVANPACASCHALFDPIGLGFENYDAIGAYRTKDGNFPVDASGSFTDGSGTTYQFSTPVQLAQSLAKSSDLGPCVALQWTSFAMARAIGTDDSASIAAIKSQFAASGFRMQALLLSIVKSDAFRLHRPPPNSL